MNIDIPVSPRAKMQNVDVEMFGDFDLDGDRSTATNDFEENSHESKSRFGGISDVEIEKLISSQENQNTKRNTSWAFGVFENWRQEKNRSVSLELAVPSAHGCLNDELFIDALCM